MRTQLFVYCLCYLTNAVSQQQTGKSNETKLFRKQPKAIISVGVETMSQTNNEVNKTRISSFNMKHQQGYKLSHSRSAAWKQFYIRKQNSSAKRSSNYATKPVGLNISDSHFADIKRHKDLQIVLKNVAKDALRLKVNDGNSRLRQTRRKRSNESRRTEYQSMQDSWGVNSTPLPGSGISETLEQLALEMKKLHKQQQLDRQSHQSLQQQVRSKLSTIKTAHEKIDETNKQMNVIQLALRSFDSEAKITRKEISTIKNNQQRFLQRLEALSRSNANLADKVHRISDSCKRGLFSLAQSNDSESKAINMPMKVAEEESGEIKDDIRNLNENIQAAYLMIEIQVNVSAVLESKINKALEGLHAVQRNISMMRDLFTLGQSVRATDIPTGSTNTLEKKVPSKTNSEFNDKPEHTEIDDARRSSERKSRKSRHVSSLALIMQASERNVEDTSRNFLDTSRNVEGTSRNVEGTSRNVEGTSRNVEDTSRNVGDTSRNVEGTSRNVKDTSRNVGDTSRNVEDTSRNVEGTSRNVDDTSRNDGDTSRNVEDTSRNVEGTSRNVEDTSRNVEDTSRNVEDTSKQKHEEIQPEANSARDRTVQAYGVLGPRFGANGNTKVNIIDDAKSETSLFQPGAGSLGEPEVILLQGEIQGLPPPCCPPPDERRQVSTTVKELQAASLPPSGASTSIDLDRPGIPYSSLGGQISNTFAASTNTDISDMAPMPILQEAESLTLLHMTKASEHFLLSNSLASFQHEEMSPAIPSEPLSTPSTAILSSTLSRTTFILESLNVDLSQTETKDDQGQRVIHLDSSSYWLELSSREIGTVLTSLVDLAEDGISSVNLIAKKDFGSNWQGSSQVTSSHSSASESPSRSEEPVLEANSIDYDALFDRHKPTISSVSTWQSPENIPTSSPASNNTPEIPVSQPVVAWDDPKLSPVIKNHKSHLPQIKRLMSSLSSLLPSQTEPLANVDHTDLSSFASEKLEMYISTPVAGLSHIKPSSLRDAMSIGAEEIKYLTNSLASPRATQPADFPKYSQTDPLSIAHEAHDYTATPVLDRSSIRHEAREYTATPVLDRPATDLSPLIGQLQDVKHIREGQDEDATTNSTFFHPVSSEDPPNHDQTKPNSRSLIDMATPAIEWSDVSPTSPAEQLLHVIPFGAAENENVSPTLSYLAQPQFEDTSILDHIHPSSRTIDTIKRNTASLKHWAHIEAPLYTEEGQEKMSTTVESLNEINSTQTSHLAQITSTQTSYLAQINSTQTSHLAQITSTQTSHLAQINSTQTSHLAQITSTQTSHLAQITSTQTSHLAQITSTQTSHLAQINSTQTSHLAQITSTQTSHLAQINSTQTSHLAQITSTQTSHLAQINSTQTSHLAQITSTQTFYLAQSVDPTDPEHIKSSSHALDNIKVITASKDSDASDTGSLFPSENLSDLESTRVDPAQYTQRSAFAQSDYHISLNERSFHPATSASSQNPSAFSGTELQSTEYSLPGVTSTKVETDIFIASSRSDFWSQQLRPDTYTGDMQTRRAMAEVPKISTSTPVMDWSDDVSSPPVWHIRDDLTKRTEAGDTKVTSPSVSHFVELEFLANTDQMSFHFVTSTTPVASVMIEISSLSSMTPVMSKMTSIMPEVSKVTPVTPEMSSIVSGIPDISNVTPVKPEKSLVTSITLEIFRATSVTPEISNVAFFKPEIPIMKSVIPEMSSITSVIPEMYSSKPVIPEMSRVIPVTSEMSNFMPVKPEMSNVIPVKPEMSNVMPVISEMSSVIPVKPEMSSVMPVTPEMSSVTAVISEISSILPVITKMPRATHFTLETTSMTSVTPEIPSMTFKSEMPNVTSALPEIPHVASDTPDINRPELEPTLSKGYLPDLLSTTVEDIRISTKHPQSMYVNYMITGDDTLGASNSNATRGVDNLPSFHPSDNTSATFERERIEVFGANQSEQIESENDSSHDQIHNVEQIGYIRHLEKRLNALEKTIVQLTSPRMLPSQDVNSFVQNRSTDLQIELEAYIENRTLDLLQRLSRDMFLTQQDELNRELEKHQLYIKNQTSDLIHELERQRNKTDELKGGLEKQKAYAKNQLAGMKQQLVRQRVHYENQTSDIMQKLSEQAMHIENQTRSLQEQIQAEKASVELIGKVASRTSMMVTYLTRQVAEINMADFTTRLRESLQNFTKNVLTQEQWRVGRKLILNASLDNEDKISQIQATLMDTTHSVTKLQGRVRSVHQMGERWYKSLQGHVIRLNNTVQDLKENALRLDDINKDQTMDYKQGSNTHLQARVDSLHVQLLYNANRLSSLEASMLNLSLAQCRRSSAEAGQVSKILALDERQKEMRKELSVVKEKVSAADLNVFKLQSSVKAAEKTIGSLRGDVASLMSVVPGVRALQKEMDNVMSLVPQDCHEHFERGHSESGVYVIHPKTFNRTARVYCFMEDRSPNSNCYSCSSCKKNRINTIPTSTNSAFSQNKNKNNDSLPGESNSNVDKDNPDWKSCSGWTVLQRRTTGVVNFTRSWAEYVEGFGAADDEYWAGNDLIHALTIHKNYELRFVMEDVFSTMWEATYFQFNLSGKEEGYKIHLSGYYGNSTDGMSSCDSSAFSTVDSDNDASSSHCALFNGGGWWYRLCHVTNLNGPYNIGMAWFNNEKQDWIQMKSSLMMIRPTID